jgi:hypothetical protein
VASFDRAISPGGEGKVVITINLKGYHGSFWKSATITSNDPKTPSVALNLKGKIRSAFEILPSPIVQFKGNGEGQREKTIHLITHSQAFQIQRTENTAKDRVDYQLETVVPGRHYRLKIVNRQKTEKYSAMIRCFTDHPQMPEIAIPIYNNPDNRTE